MNGAVSYGASLGLLCHQHLPGGPIEMTHLPVGV